MCIALISTAHPKYKLILIDNRDEFVNRPTATAEWWPSPYHDVLGGRDLLRPIQGTWLGMTQCGKIAVLTNYREQQPPDPNAVSRGAIIRKFLTEDVGPMEDFVRTIVSSGIARDAGGFSLVCGRVGKKLAIISNRAEDQTQVPWIAGDVVQTVGLSNAAFSNRTWKKVNLGEELMLGVIRANVQSNDGEDRLVGQFLELLSHDTLTRHKDLEKEGLDAHVLELRNSIFIPPLGRKATDGTLSGIYGTQKQTVILVDHDDNVRFFERTLYDQNSDPIPRGDGDQDFKFQIRR
jgi:uncharacterized protein with NRDE domain